MNCFNDENQAVAVCVNCGRAICANCGMVSKSDKNVCCERCAKEAEQTDLFRRRMLSMSSKLGITSGVFSLVMGLIFLLFSYLVGEGEFFYYLLLMGLLSLFSGLAFLWYSRIKHYNGVSASGSSLA